MKEGFIHRGEIMDLTAFLEKTGPTLLVIVR